MVNDSRCGRTGRLARAREGSAASASGFVPTCRRKALLSITVTLLISMMPPVAWIYILTNKYNTTLYVGMTNDLPRRLWEHRTKRYPGSFSARYNLSKLIYYEDFDTIEEALDREDYIKGKTRK